MEKIIAEIKIENQPIIKIELNEQEAPQSVYNFCSLANKKFYDGLKFHRVIKDFVAQGGDPDGNGTGGPGYSIKGEFTQNGVPNKLEHTKGAISMARSQALDSAGSQFYLTLADVNFLDGQYAVFGYIIEGKEVLEHFNQIQTEAGDIPSEDIIIETIIIQCEKELPEPNKL